MGRRCPICSDVIFPPSNLVSPVSEALRAKLSQVNWGRNELGLPLLSDEIINKSSYTPMEMPKSTYKENVAQSRMNVYIPGSESIPKPEPYSVLNIDQDYYSSRQPLLTREPPVGSSDRDDNKYQRKTPREIFNRWSRRFYAPAARPFYRKTWFHVVFGVFVFLFIIYIMSTVGRSSSNDNPMLDMELNPNIINHED